MNKNDLRAPKDALEKREGFYVLKNLEIQATTHLDGSRRQEIYLDSGRLVNAAKLNGNLTDEEMLNNLRKTTDFKKMVHSIGVSLTANSSSSVFNFKLINYGLKDPYNGGTHISADVAANGIEQKILLENIEWSEDDNDVGQFAISFPESEEFGKISVRLYLNDGFHAPAEEEENELDTTSDAYKKVISESLLNLGNTERIKKAIEKARHGNDVTIAYIGGSITQGAGAVPINTECYAYKSFEAFRDMFAADKEKMHYVKQGIGGTSSELGVVRYENDITQNGKILPDVVIVEFAVNDAGDETEGLCYEGLVRKIYNSENRPAVILLFSVFADNYTLQDRFIPLGNKCSLPMISLKNAVTEQFDKKSGEGKVISRQQYFYDIFHPTNTGHKVMADCIANYFDNADKAPKEDALNNIPVYRSDAFEFVKLIKKEDFASHSLIKDFSAGSFTNVSTELQAVERNLERERTPEFPDNWQYRGNGKNVEPFKFTVTSKLLMIVMMDSGSANACKVRAVVDGKEKRIFDPRDVNWTHCNSLIIYQNEETAEHKVELFPVDNGNEIQEFAILAFAVA